MGTRPQDFLPDVVISKGLGPSFSGVQGRSPDDGLGTKPQKLTTFF